MIAVHKNARPAMPLSTRRERVGWYVYDWANSAFITTVVTVFIGPYLTAIANEAAGCADLADDEDCGTRIPLLFLDILPGQLFPYLVSLSVILTVFALPLVGVICDRSPHKRELMVYFAYLGAATTIAMLLLVDDRYLLGSALFVLANVSYGASIVVYNSFLPQLASADDRDTVSSIGWAVGYIGGGTLLALNLAALLLREQLGITEGDAVRYIIVSAGIWWAAFTTVPLLTLRNRPPLEGPARGFPLAEGFQQLWQTLKGMRAHPLTLLFLLAYLVYSDGIATVIALSAVYGSEELWLEQQTLVMTVLIVNVVAFPGALAMGRIAVRFGARRTVLTSLALWSLVVGAAYFLPARQVLPFMLLGVAIGLVLGGSQSLSRSLFSQLVPMGKEGEYFGIYEIADKSTSWLGPLLFGMALGMTGSYRVAIVSVVLFFLVGSALLLMVPIRRAIVAAGNLPPRVV
jgi:MFS transporter, UMF1 family